MEHRMEAEREPAIIDENAVVEFTTGACGYLAVALHDLTGWPIYAEYDPPPHDDYVAHMWVENPDGCAVDIGGIHSGAWATTKYSEPMPGKILQVDRATALGNADNDYMEWARDIVECNPDHFGVAVAPKHANAS